MRNNRLVFKIPLLVLVFFVFLFCFCARKPVMTLTGIDNGTRVEMQSGEVLAISLEAQLGTGYGWKVVSRSGKLVLDGEPSQAPVGKVRPGGLELQTFRFKAIEKGEAEIRLRYAQSWRRETKALKEFTVTVIVK